MLPSLVAEPPTGSHWIHEVKHDGYRTLLLVDGGTATAFTRNRNDWTHIYPGIVAAAAKLKCRSAIIDGEVIFPDAEGRSDFHAIRAAIGNRGRGLVFVAFDLPFLDGKDLRSAPLEERRALLRKLIPTSAKSCLQFSEAVEGDGAACFAAAERLGLEGIVSKRLGSSYRSGRTDRWRKVKCWTESQFVIVGTEIDSRSGAPVALLAREEESGLRYAGGAFFALRAPQREALSDRLERLTAPKPAIPALRRRGARWVKPELVVGVKHLRGSGGLRHATVRSIEEA